MLSLLLPALVVAEPSPPPPRKWQRACAEVLKLALRDLGLPTATVEYERVMVGPVPFEIVRFVLTDPEMYAASVNLTPQGVCADDTGWERSELLIHRDTRSHGCYASIVSAMVDNDAFFKRMRKAADACMQLPTK